MATPKGAKVTKTETKELVLNVVGPDGELKLIGEADTEDALQVEWLRGMADKFSEGHVAHKLIERSTTVRTQVVERDLT